MNSETPRTDAEDAFWANSEANWVVSSDFARQLERELTAERADKSAAKAEADQLRQQLAEAQKEQPEKRAPVQGFAAGIPWSMHLRAYDEYCRRYGRQEALITGWCRGGFGVEELDMFIPGWRGELNELNQLRAQLSARDEEIAAAAMQLKEAQAALISQRDDYEKLMLKGVEAIGCVRWCAILFGLNGPEWSEEPGFANKVANAGLKFTGEKRQRDEQLRRMRECIEKARLRCYEDFDERDPFGRVVEELDAALAAAPVVAQSSDDLIAQQAASLFPPSACPKCGSRRIVGDGNQYECRECDHGWLFPAPSGDNGEAKA